MTEISLNYDVLQKCMGSEQYFTEATEHAASFNTRMKLERKMRLPFLDSQTGVAQNHTDIWHTYRHRQPGKFHGQIYSYPEKRWKKKKHFFQFPEIKSLKATDIETGESGGGRGIREPLITFSKCQVPFLQSHRQMRTNPIDKHAAYLEPRYMFAEPSTVRRKLRSFNTDMQLHPDMHQISTVENPAAAGSGVGRAEPEEFPSETSKEKWYDEYDEYMEPPDAGEVCDEVSDMSDYEETFKKKKKKANKGGGRPRGRKKATKERDLEAERLEEEKEKPYACEVCSARYKTRPGLSYHYAHFHGGMMEPEEAEASPKAVDEVEPVKRKVPVRRQPPRGSSGPTSTLDPGSHIPTGERGEDGKVQSSDYCDFCLGDSVENKKSGIPEELVSCSDCGRSGHPTCLQFTDNMTISVKKYPWQCIECKSCGLCGTSENDEQLLFCDDCDRGYHMYCLNPPLAEAPEGNWSCHLCIEEFHGGKKPEGMQ